MTERHWTILRLLLSLSLNCWILRNLGQEDNHECQREDSKSDTHKWEYLANLCLCNLRYEYTCQEDNSCTHQRVERATNLNELVTTVTTATELVQHRVNNEVEQTHRETCDECTKEIYTKCSDTTQKTCDSLNAYTYETDEHCQESGLLVAVLGEKVTTRDTHYCVSNKVAEYTKSSHPVRNCNLLTCKVELQHITHWRRQVCHERNHTEEQDAHDNRRQIRILFLCHKILVFIGLKK